MQLSEIISQKIKSDGPISFHDFMEMALYSPGKGYYTSGKKRMGKNGDYYTSPALSSLFGQMIGKQIEEMFCLMGSEPISIVEYGGGTGILCSDVMEYLENNRALYEYLKYYIIEKNGNSIAAQKIRKDKVEYINAFKKINGFTGCVLSNEVVDNFPVHAVVMQQELMEVFIDYKDKFIEVLVPAGEELKNYLATQNIVLPKNYRTEINLHANEWIAEIARYLKKGFVITIDYGFMCNELYSRQRSMGTLACYHNHTVSDTPYYNIGEQDITAHINFSALHFWGKKYGLECTGFCNQNYFLRSMGLANHLRKMEMENTCGEKKHLFFQLNKLLMEMGNNFKILIQQKGVKTNRITGMQFSQNLS